MLLITAMFPALLWLLRTMAGLFMKVRLAFRTAKKRFQ